MGERKAEKEGLTALNSCKTKKGLKSMIYSYSTAIVDVYPCSLKLMSYSRGLCCL